MSKLHILLAVILLQQKICPVVIIRQCTSEGPTKFLKHACMHREDTCYGQRHTCFLSCDWVSCSAAAEASADVTACRPAATGVATPADSAPPAPLPAFIAAASATRAAMDFFLFLPVICAPAWPFETKVSAVGTAADFCTGCPEVPPTLDAAALLSSSDAASFRFFPCGCAGLAAVVGVLTAGASASLDLASSLAEGPSLFPCFLVCFNDACAPASILVAASAAGVALAAWAGLGPELCRAPGLLAASCDLFCRFASARSNSLLRAYSTSLFLALTSGCAPEEKSTHMSGARLVPSPITQ